MTFTLAEVLPSSFDAFNLCFSSVQFHIMFKFLNSIYFIMVEMQIMTTSPRPLALEQVSFLGSYCGKTRGSEET